MAKGLYIGVDSKARKSKKMYFGVDNKARKIKKVYIGVENKARLLFNEHVPSIIAHIYPNYIHFSHPRSNHGAGSTKNHAIFAGGYYESNTYSDCDTYDSTLTRSVIRLSYASQYLQSGNIGGYVIFGGGKSSDGSYTTGCHIINDSLTTSSISGPSNFAGYGAFAKVGNYCIYGGGSLSTATNEVKYINTSLTIGSCTALATAATQVSGASTKDYAIIAGGNTNSDSITGNGNAYNASLTRSTLWIKSAYNMGSTSFLEDALFGCGNCSYSSDRNIMIRVTNTLTKASFTLSSINRDSATSTPNFAIFCATDPSKQYDVFDTSYTMKTIACDNGSYFDGKATSFGNYAFFSTSILATIVEEV